MNGAITFEAKEVVGYIIAATEILLQTSIASPAMELLLQTLITVIHEEYVLRRDLYDEAKQLQATLSIIQAYLGAAEKKSIDHDAVKIWLRELEALTLDADNVVDKLTYHLLHKEMKKMKTPSCKNKVLSCFSSFNHIIARERNMAVEIKEINMNFEAMNTRASEFGILVNVDQLIGRQSMIVNDDAPHDYSFETIDPIFIGRDDDVDKLVDVVTDSPAREREFSIVAIAGMGGLGKTTLTRKVFNHQKIKNRFGSLIWVCVSQTFDLIILFKKILSALTSHTNLEGVDERMEMILKRLKEALKDKTYLLVLDDVWNEDLSKWEDFMNFMSGATCTKGNAIIITTRSTHVASVANPLHIHRLKGLSDEDCWSIIKAKAFESGEAPTPGFEMIGRKIAERCGGLPLTARSAGSELHRRRSEEEWRSIEQKWLTDADVNILKSLRLSFDNLSSPLLRKCFTYCSVFPKGHRIEKQILIEMWMAEGFLGADDKEMESVGDMYFELLLSNSLLQQVAERDHPHEGYAMHHLLHDVASSVLSSWTDADGNSLVRYSFRDEQSPVLPKQAVKYLRTLVLQGDISGTLFSDFESLHVLTLDGCNVEELPSSIRKLIHLRNLNISRTSIEKLPDWIDQLLLLQTLRAEGEYLRKLPSTLKYLIKLRHLYIYNNVELPAEIGRLTHLRTLRYFPVGTKNGFKIEELGSLRNLKGNLTIDHLEKVEGKEEAKKANMSEKPELKELVLKWDRNRSEGETNDDESVLEGLKPHPNLSKLRIEGFKGKRFPWWTMNDVVEIRLSWCSECEEIPNMPNLKSLYLERLKKMRFIDSHLVN